MALGAKHGLRVIEDAAHSIGAEYKGRRVGTYVPDALVPQIQRALDNGRALQALLYEAGRRYTAAVKQARTAKR